jgi:hypothetical protein
MILILLWTLALARSFQLLLDGQPRIAALLITIVIVVTAIGLVGRWTNGFGLSATGGALLAVAAAAAFSLFSIYLVYVGLQDITGITLYSGLLGCVVSAFMLRAGVRMWLLFRHPPADDDQPPP